MPIFRVSLTVLPKPCSIDAPSEQVRRMLRVAGIELSGLRSGRVYMLLLEADSDEAALHKIQEILAVGILHNHATEEASIDSVTMTCD